MKYLLTILLAGLPMLVLNAQDETEGKYKISDEQMQEYKTLAKQLTENLDTTLELTDKEREKVYMLKLQTLVDQHKFVVQEDELRQQIREIKGEQRKIERATNDKVEKLAVEKDEQEVYREALRREKKHLRQYDMQRRTAQRRARLDELRKAREENEESEED